MGQTNGLPSPASCFQPLMLQGSPCRQQSFPPNCPVCIGYLMDSDSRAALTLMDNTYQ